jgi:hypothetical protein
VGGAYIPTRHGYCYNIKRKKEVVRRKERRGGKEGKWRPRRH